MFIVHCGVIKDFMFLADGNLTCNNLLFIKWIPCYRHNDIKDINIKNVESFFSNGYSILQINIQKYTL